jgi:hypothetical protein
MTNAMAGSSERPVLLAIPKLHPRYKATPTTRAEMIRDWGEGIGAVVHLA